MVYIWINPVTASMYEADILNDFLNEHGYQRFEVITDWLSIVRQKYETVIERSKNTVIDMRCPKVIELLKELGVEENVYFPDIHPILIHCGIEASEREDLLDEKKIITTPCQALADMGNALKLKNTHFLSWNRFLQMLGKAPEGKLPHKSPIPPGFFKVLNVSVDSLSGEDEIREYFKKFNSENVQLVELLYCKEGCHNGDGIRAVKEFLPETFNDEF